MIQLQYKNVGKVPKPTAEEFAGWRQAFIEGRKVPGVRIHAIDWQRGGTQDEIRARLRNGHRSHAPGIVERYAAPDVTMCDYDRPNEKPMLRIWAVARMLRIRPKFVEFHRTKRGWHVVVQWNRKFSDEAIVALQAILGSDAFRETYNLARVFSGSKETNAGKRWNLLFREKIR